jgi:hypothetical protein
LIKLKARFQTISLELPNPVKTGKKYTGSVEYILLEKRVQAKGKKYNKKASHFRDAPNGKFGCRIQAWPA